MGELQGSKSKGRATKNIEKKTSRWTSKTGNVRGSSGEGGVADVVRPGTLIYPSSSTQSLHDTAMPSSSSLEEAVEWQRAKATRTFDQHADLGDERARGDTARYLRQTRANASAGAWIQPHH